MEGVGLSAVPSEVWESTELIKVDLSRNSIQELPVELSSCINLQVKYLYTYCLPACEGMNDEVHKVKCMYTGNFFPDLVILLVTIILWLDFRSFMHCLGVRLNGGKG